MVKILVILKSPCAKGCYLIQKLEPEIGRVYLHQYFGNNFFFHNLTCWRYEGFKNLVSHTQQKNVLRMGHLIYGVFISSASQIMKEKNLFPKHWGKYTYTQQIVAYATNFSITDNSKFTYTMTSVLFPYL